MKDTRENRINFLKENGAWDAFKKNISEQEDIETIDTALDDPDPYFISCCFVWNKTEQGEDFWRALDFEYRNLLKINK